MTVLNFENIDWSAQSTPLTATGGGGANSLIGGYGGDMLDGAGGADTVKGNAGNDRIWYDGADVIIDGGADNDTLLLRGAATINLNNGTSDQASGDSGLTTGFEYVDARASSVAVTITGRSDFYSYLYGGSAGDTITAGDFGNNITGGGGADTLRGGANNDVFQIYAGDFVSGETIDGKGGNNTIAAHATTDFSGAAAGALTNIFYYGIDTYDAATFTYLNQNVTVTLRGDQLAGVGVLYANSDVSGSVDTFNINTVANGSVDVSNLAFYNFGSEDHVNINGSTGNETLTIGTNFAFSVDGKGGADVIHAAGDYASGTQIQGGAGNDAIDYGVGTSNVTIDGGADNDTLVGSYYSAFFSNVTLDLSLSGDQTSGDSTTVLNFENVDWSAAYGRLMATGSAGANTLIGGFDSDSLSGAGGADLIDGGPDSSVDTLTGGTGADSFRWTTRQQAGDFGDYVTDFSSVDDTLVFKASAFDFNGPNFDIAINDTTGSASIGRADLVRYSGAVANGANDIASYLNANGTGSTGEGIFVLASDSSGNAVLYHATDAHTGADTVAVATLTGVSINQVQLSDFSFV